MLYKIVFLVFISFLLVSCEQNSEFEHAITSIESHSPFDYKLDVKYSKGSNIKI